MTALTNEDVLNFGTSVFYGWGKKGTDGVRTTFQQALQRFVLTFAPENEAIKRQFGQWNPWVWPGCPRTTKFITKYDEFGNELYICGHCGSLLLGNDDFDSCPVCHWINKS